MLTTLSSQLPKEIKIVEIADRGYGKSILLKNRLKRQELFIIPGRRDVGVHYEENKKTYRKSLGGLKHSLGKPCRYRNCPSTKKLERALVSLNAFPKRKYSFY